MCVLEFSHHQILMNCRDIYGWLSGRESACQFRKLKVRSLGCEDPLEKEVATHSSILAWAIPWTEEPGGLQSMGSQRSWTLATRQQGYVVKTGNTANIL